MNEQMKKCENNAPKFNNSFDQFLNKNFMSAVKFFDSDSSSHELVSDDDSLQGMTHR